MKRFPQPIVRLTLVLSFIFLMGTVLYGVSPGIARAQTLDEALHLSESTPGGLTITWYSAKRFTQPPTQRSTGHSLTNLLGFSGYYGQYFEDYTPGQIDITKSKQAYNNFDRSVYLGTESLSLNSLKDGNWKPGNNSTQLSADSYVWGDVTGYIKMPQTGCLEYLFNDNCNADFYLNIDGAILGKWGSSINRYAANKVSLLLIGKTFEINKDTVIPFSFRIGKCQADSSNQDSTVSLDLYSVDSQHWFNPRDYGKCLPVDCFYSKLSLKDMPGLFKFNPKDYSLTTDPLLTNFPAENYECGIVSGDINQASVADAAGFQALKLGVNYLTPDSGTVIIRDKIFKSDYISIASASLAAPRNLTVTRRTANTADLSWEVPLQEVPSGFKITYDIYRKDAGPNPKLSFPQLLSYLHNPAKVGSTTDLSFTDQGLSQDVIYEYYVKAEYPTGASSPSNIVNSDSVAMEGLPSTPDNLRSGLANQANKKADLQLSWTAANSSTGIKEYIVYRLRTRPKEAYEPKEIVDESGNVTGYTLGDIMETIPVEIGRTAKTSYVDSGPDFGDTCDYYVQAVDINGTRSYLSTCLTASVAEMSPPSAPGNLRAGGVLRQGDKMEYVFQENSAFRNVLLGPEREIALRWEPSSDNVGVIGYNIYRVDKTPQVLSDQSAGQVSSGTSAWLELLLTGGSDPFDIFSGQNFHLPSELVSSTPTTGIDSVDQKNLVGTTKETQFIDKGVEFGKLYDYCVEAKDDSGNNAISHVIVGTGKPTLAELAVTDGSQLHSDNEILTPGDPDEDTGNVDNRTFNDLTLSDPDEDTGNVDNRTFNDLTLQDDLTIANGSQNLDLEPPFFYFQTEYTLNVENAVKSITLTPKATDPQARVMINGVEAAGDSGILMVLDPGKNTILVDVVPRESFRSETMSYTLTVNRANLDNLPELTLPEDGIILNEGDTYKAVGKIVIPGNLAWTGTADYGDGSGEQSLQLNKDGSFILEHQYLDNGRYTINVKFRYKDLGLVKGTLEVIIQNVAPTLTGLKDEYTAGECSPLTIEGSIADPGQDTWTVSGDYGSEWGPTRGTVNQHDKTFTLQDYFNDQKPEYDMVLKVKDDDGGESSKNIKIRVENAAPVVQAGGPALVQAGAAFIGGGSFTDPGLDTWQATVDYGDGGGEQSLTLRNDKTFDLNHTYLKTGIFTVTVRVEDRDGGAGSASFLAKVKDYLFSFEAGEDASLNEGDQLVRDIPVQGRPDKVKSITVDYGDGSGEQSIAWSDHNPDARSNDAVIIQASAASRKDKLALTGWLPLQHTYTDNGSYPVKIKLTDVDGDSYEDGFIVNAANVEPTVQLDSINNMYPGNTFTSHGKISDPGADTWTVTIDYKDGSAPDKIDITPDKTFSFSHTYKYSGCYNIEAVVSDDDGGTGRGSTPVNVLSPGSGGGASSDDATLHSFEGIPDLKQNDGVHASDGFIPDCLEYKSTAGFVHTQITAAAAPGAALTYTIDGGPAQVLEQNQPTGIDLDAGHTLKIQVTARDGITNSEYTFAHL